MLFLIYIANSIFIKHGLSTIRIILIFFKSHFWRIEKCNHTFEIGVIFYIDPNHLPIWIFCNTSSFFYFLQKSTIFAF